MFRYDSISSDDPVLTMAQYAAEWDGAVMQFFDDNTNEWVVLESRVEGSIGIKMAVVACRVNNKECQLAGPVIHQASKISVPIR